MISSPSRFGERNCSIWLQGGSIRDETADQWGVLHHAPARLWSLRGTPPLSPQLVDAVCLQDGGQVPFDLMIIELELTLPAEPSGVEVIHQVRNTFPDLPV